jgi:cellulose synthase/poly-beta-1,6-N-acetylglucosamine synthase-like glycosyltransferase
MARYLYRKSQAQKWFDQIDIASHGHLGVILRGSQAGPYVYEPVTLNTGVVQAVEQLGVPVAISMASEFTDALFQQLAPFQTEVNLAVTGPIVPVVRSVNEIHGETAAALKEAYMCLCRDQRILLIWGPSVESIVAHGTDVEGRIVSHIWGAPIQPAPVHHNPYRFSSSGAQTPAAQTPGRDSSTIEARKSYFLEMAAPGYNPAHGSVMDEKLGVIQAALEKEEQGDKAFDPENESQEAPKRPFMLIHACMIGLSIILCIVVEMACVAKMLREVQYDGNYIRFALLAVVPLFMIFSLFFMIVVSGALFQLVGPLSGLSTNSKFYSAKAPKPGRYPDLVLPHITIQMPVYKEGLKGVIIPTVTSVLAAIRHYEKLGGTASLYVNDDGMQLITPELAEARKAFYELNQIGWCSRPPHCTEEGENYFLRKGQFKKASNMNYCLDFSIRVEDEYLKRVKDVCQSRSIEVQDLTIEEEDEIYHEARNFIVEGDNGRTWAAGDVRLGELILLIDSDTRVPEDCLLYGALEMHESPELALLQHASGILQVVNNAFENGITYFTNLIYTSIQFACAQGDAAPFVGHNTFIRWKAIQSISWEEDGIHKFWSDSHVSEDFDLSLRLQMNHFTVRLAAYHNGGFKEGVSLTVYDELARWEKYAYGCNELVFNPLIRWPTRGPFTRLFLRFLWSNVKITSKITILAYIGTYYAIASSVPLALANYLMVGWLVDDIDQFYLTSWQIFVGMVVVFNVLSPLGYSMLRHRMGQVTFIRAVWETIKWTPMFLLFFGGISIHLMKALLCHTFSIKMEWTTTAKELEASGFRVGLDRIVKDFKYMYLVLLVLTAGMIYLGSFAPYGWSISDFSAIVPLANQIGCHALLPFALGLF